jgi:serine/threonine protein phosphatase 1
MTGFPTSLSLEPNARGKDWVIPDVHGCEKTLKKLISWLDISDEDRLFFLGDLVNKGPRSFEVLDYLMKMEADGYHILKVMGNHDLLWLDLLRGNISVNHSKILGRDDLKWDSSKNDTYIDFLERSYFFIEMGRSILVHAGLNFNADDPFSDFVSMTSIRAFVPDERTLNGRRVIHGHIAQPMEQIELAITQKLQKIPLDNGCVYFGNRAGMGKLLALNPGTFELKTVTNIDV